MKITVIIPCFNAADTLGFQIEALAAQECPEPWELIIADNGSRDGSVKVAESYRPKVPHLRVIDASERRGVAHVRNVAVGEAQGEAVIFCDADDIVSPGFLAAMYRAFLEYDFIACRLDGTKLNHSWIAKARAKAVSQQHGLQKGDFHLSLPYAGGCGLGVKKWVHESVGGFDESLLRQADTDYCIRVQLNGTPLHFVPEALYHLRWRDSAWKTFHQVCLWSKYGMCVRRRYLPADQEQNSLFSSVLGIAKNMCWRLIHIRTKEDLAEWIWLCGWNVGLIQGWIKFRKASSYQPAAPSAVSMNPQ